MSIPRRERSGDEDPLTLAARERPPGAIGEIGGVGLLEGRQGQLAVVL